VNLRQTQLDEFEAKTKDLWNRFPEDIRTQYENNEKLKREYYKHLDFMERLFAKIVEDLEKRG